MKEILILAAGGLVGIVATYLTARQKFRDDLQARYDETLHNTRIGTYQDLWGRMQVLAKYARPEPVTPSRLRRLAEELRAWYYEVGGLFLSDNSRDRYFDLQDAIVAELKKDHADEDKDLDNDSFEAIREQSSTLRTSLSSDLRSRNAPRL